VAVGEAFPTGPAFLLAKSSFPSLKTPTVLSQQELGNPLGKAFANSLALLAKHAFPVVFLGLEEPDPFWFCEIRWRASIDLLVYMASD
jgi:hypothetical protein